MVNCKFTHKEEFFDQSHALTLSLFTCIETNSSMAGPLFVYTLEYLIDVGYGIIVLGGYFLEN